MLDAGHDLEEAQQEHYQHQVYATISGRKQREIFDRMEKSRKIVPPNVYERSFKYGGWFTFPWDSSSLLALVPTLSINLWIGCGEPYNSPSGPEETREQTLRDESPGSSVDTNLRAPHVREISLLSQNLLLLSKKPSRKSALCR